MEHDGKDKIHAKSRLARNFLLDFLSDVKRTLCFIGHVKKPPTHRPP